MSLLSNLSNSISNAANNFSNETWRESPIESLTQKYVTPSGSFGLQNTFGDKPIKTSYMLDN